MVDKQARAIARSLIERWCKGSITNWQFEDGWPSSQDKSIEEIFNVLWTFYHDYPERTVDSRRLPSSQRDIIHRCMRFLETPLECGPFEAEELRRNAQASVQWPFAEG